MLKSARKTVRELLALAAKGSGRSPGAIADLLAGRLKAKQPPALRVTVAGSGLIDMVLADGSWQAALGPSQPK